MSGLCYADSVVIMSLKTVKYFSTIIVAAIAVFAGWWMWNYYMQSPWTRDGKVRAEQVSITPQVSGSISELYIKDNQFVNKGDVLFIIDKTPFHIAELNAQAQLQKRSLTWRKPITKPTVAVIYRKITSQPRIWIPQIST
jgi:multidrug resistance efflux pump